jgi:hypothetical protein
MTSKKLWIIGGCLIVAIGAVAYMTNNSASAGKDAAGTLVEANRAHADAPTPAPGTDTTQAPDPGSTDAADAAKGQTGVDPAAASDAAAAGNGDGARNVGARNVGARNVGARDVGARDVGARDSH